MSTLAVARHHNRRRKMLEQHEKEIKSVPQFDETLIPMSAMLLLAQIFGAVATQQLPLGQKAILAYAIGAPIAHASFLLCHECSHNNASPAPWINKMTAIVANGAVGVPFAISFRHYHRLHHQNQNSSEDPDMPTQLERLLLQGIGGKLFFCAFQLFFYALRPVLCFKPPPADRWIALNVTFQLAVNAAVVAVSGWDSLIYMLISTWLAGSLHPLSGHFLAEHAETEKDVFTYSYYGPLNMLSFNVGYHNEHHDFPNIPGRYLPRIRTIGRQFYDKLPSCKSWPGALIDFVFDSSLSLDAIRTPLTK